MLICVFEFAACCEFLRLLCGLFVLFPSGIFLFCALAFLAVTWVACCYIVSSGFAVLLFF